MKTTGQRPDVRVGDGLLDRLVDGELDEVARAAVLRELDGEPGGWKRCALAFLEAQAWRAAMSVEAGAVTPVRVRPVAARFSVWRQVTGVAAAVVVAFGVGLVARGPSQSDSGRPGGGRGPTEFVAADPAAPPAAVSPAVPEDLRRRMERQGYRVDGDRKLVPVALEDGRRVTVPVDRVSMRYVGQRIH